MKKLPLFLLFFFLANHAFPQLAFKSTKKENREKLFRNMVRNSINGNLSKPLNDSTEEYWQDAFWAMLVTQYKSPWINNKIHEAFTGLQIRSIEFKRSLLEMACALYPEQFTNEIKTLQESDTSILIFAMTEIYLANLPNAENSTLLPQLKEKIISYPNNNLLQHLNEYISKEPVFPNASELTLLFGRNFLPGKELLISIQRHNRNQPGLMVFRKADGKFVTDSNGIVVHYPQLARSLTNLPWFFRNGNTPQGLYRMAGFDVSGSSFIGPTPNLQMRMPFEIWPSQFISSEATDSTWSIEKYNRLIPRELKTLSALYQSYFAGALGRTEIIAHGTTVDPEFYKSTPFYPLTPTQGCLTAKEIWDENTGILKESDQRKMVDALLIAGGAKGFVLVIEIDDQQRPVELSDLLPYIE